MKSSKWEVVALGELQQPSAVGADQAYNPVVDGPNPNGPDFADNAGNSPEQEQALETWVNAAVDMLNRGEPEEAILARLSHDGCPNPEEVLQRAQAQPNESPVSDSIGQDPFETPAPQDGQTGQMESLSQQPPVLGHIDVRIEGKDWSKWVAANLPGADPEAHPVSEIEKFISNLPEVEPARPEIRITHIKKARRAIRGVLSKATYGDQQKLAALDHVLDLEEHDLKTALHSDAWLGSRQESVVLADAHTAGNDYRFNAFQVAEPERTPYIGNVKEAALIWASEVSYAPGVDLIIAAKEHAELLGLSNDQFARFAEVAQEAAQHRHVRAEEFTSEPTENEGPAEQLFV